MKRFYIAGPIKGNPDYAEKFAAAEKFLADKYDCETVNPVKIAENFVARLRETWPVKTHIEDMPYNVLFRQDIVALMNCDAVFMLDGWENSRGACAEHAIAVALDLEIFYQS